jgi:hypothetical protein
VATKIETSSCLIKGSGYSQATNARHLWACFDHLMFKCMISINENNKHAINYLLSPKNPIKRINNN